MEWLLLKGVRVHLKSVPVMAAGEIHTHTHKVIGGGWGVTASSCGWAPKLIGGPGGTRT